MPVPLRVLLFVAVLAAAPPVRANAPAMSPAACPADSGDAVIMGYGAAALRRSRHDPGYPLQRVGDEWVLDLHLDPGKYTYKLVVNGAWILDPGNPQWQENEYGTGNSVLWIKGPADETP